MISLIAEKNAVILSHQGPTMKKLRLPLAPSTINLATPLPSYPEKVSKCNIT